LSFNHSTDFTGELYSATQAYHCSQVQRIYFQNKKKDKKNTQYKEV